MTFADGFTTKQKAGHKTVLSCTNGTISQMIGLALIVACQKLTLKWLKFNTFHQRPSMLWSFLRLYKNLCAWSRVCILLSLLVQAWRVMPSHANPASLTPNKNRRHRSRWRKELRQTDIIKCLYRQNSEHIALGDAAKMSAQLNMTILNHTKLNQLSLLRHQLHLEHVDQTATVQTYSKLVLAVGANPILSGHCRWW